MKNVFFFQTQQIPDSSSIFDQFNQQNIFFSYFQVDQNYYLFVYAQKSIDINFLYQSIDVIQELDSKQRKIRSFRGFFLYALEIMQMGENYEILKTNLQPFFWRKVKTIIRQNQKGALLEFLFGKAELNQDQTLGLIPHLEDQIQTLQNQVDSLAQQVERLQQKIIQLESNLENSEYALRGTLHAPDDRKTIQQGDSTLEGKKAPYLQENDTKINSNLHQGEEPRHQISKTVSEDKITPVKPLSNNQRYDSPLKSESLLKDKIRPVTPLSNSQQYNLYSNQEKGLQQPNFITLSKIPEEEQIEIIQKGFQLKGYSINYERIRCTKFYQQFKE